MSGHGPAGPSFWRRDECTVFSLVPNERGQATNWFSAHVQPGSPGVGASVPECVNIARLIQAAPAMLEALQKLDSYIDFTVELQPGEWEIKNTAGINKAFAQAHAALAAAEGTDND